MPPPRTGRSLAALAILSATVSGCQLPVEPAWPLEEFGASLLLADFNCDGVRDVVVGAPHASRVDVFFTDPESLLPESVPSVRLYGEVRGDAFGKQLARLTRYADDDGCEAIAVGATNRGKTYVYDGGQPEPVFVFERTSNSGRQALASAQLPGDPYSDLLVSGQAQAWLLLGTDQGLSPDPAWEGQQEESGQQYGQTVGFGGADDDRLDVIVADNRYDASQQLVNVGRIYVYENQVGGQISETATLTLDGTVEQERLGSTLVIGDIDADGDQELVTGSPLLDAGTNGGAVRIFSGPLTGLQSVQLIAEGGFADFGEAVELIDLDPPYTGEKEVVIGAPRANGETTNSGRIYVYRGEDFGDFTGPVPDAAQVVLGVEDRSRWGEALRAGYLQVEPLGEPVLLVGSALRINEGRVLMLRASGGLFDPEPVWSAEGY